MARARATACAAGDLAERARRWRCALTPWIDGGVRRVEPDSGEGGAGDDGHASRTCCASRWCRWRRDTSRRRARARGRRARFPHDAGADRVARRAHRRASRRHRPGRALPTETRGDRFEQLLAALERGEVRAAERSGDGEWHAVPWVKRGILLGFRVGRVVDMSPRDWRCAGCSRVLRQAHVPAASAHAGERRARRARRHRRSAAARTSRRASCACRRCTSTSARTSARAR